MARDARGHLPGCVWGGDGSELRRPAVRRVPRTNCTCDEGVDEPTVLQDMGWVATSTGVFRRSLGSSEIVLVHRDVGGWFFELMTGVPTFCSVEFGTRTACVDGVAKVLERRGDAVVKRE